MEDGLDQDRVPDQNTTCSEYESESRMNNENSNMITIVNCNTCMTAIIILHPGVNWDKMISTMAYGCVPVYMSSTCSRCLDKLTSTKEYAIPCAFPMAASMVFSSTTFRRFISTYGVWPKIAGTSFHKVVHPNEIIDSLPDKCTFLSVIQSGFTDMDVVECVMEEFF